MAFNVTNRTLKQQRYTPATFRRPVRRRSEESTLEVLFATGKLHRQLNSTAKARKVYGDVMAKKIGLRLQQMEAARSLDDLRNLPGRWHELTGDLRGSLACDLVQPHRLIFRPTTEPPPRRPDESLDWSAVDSVTISDVTDYH